ncbi:hypothetical protein GIS00_19190 [Nakamurella sp. YIM 132087]|uniref:Uncharacterized protein n=1 Tax=Nakamurella alba TaxID=2665158 RepID=A0A7K1FPJ8_9ACTN|nr:hypothetical protein [Nakamurella alba]MTD16066.1 hypothetical protein [Nakamurella alba]
MRDEELGQDEATLRLVACPECSAPAEIVDSSRIGSTGGPMEVVRVRCVVAHQFLMAAERLHHL